MSDMRIVGPKNTPLLVDKNGRAWVLSEEHDVLLAHAFRGKAYHVLAEVNLTDTSLTPLLFFGNDDNTDDRVMVMETAVISADANVHVEIFVGESYTSGGGNATIVNLNRGVTTDPDVTVKDASTAALVLGGTGAETHSLYVGAYAPTKLNLDVVLPKSKSLSIKAEGANTNKVRVHIYFFLADLPSSLVC